MKLRQWSFSRSRTPNSGESRAMTGGLRSSGRLKSSSPRMMNQVIDEWIPAQVVQFQQFREGDNALLKVSGLAPLQPLVISRRHSGARRGAHRGRFPGKRGRTSGQGSDAAAQLQDR